MFVINQIGFIMLFLNRTWLHNFLNEQRGANIANLLSQQGWRHGQIQSTNSMNRISSPTPTTINVKKRPDLKCRQSIFSTDAARLAELLWHFVLVFCKASSPVPCLSYLPNLWLATIPKCGKQHLWNVIKWTYLTVQQQAHDIFLLASVLDLTMLYIFGLFFLMNVVISQALMNKL